MCMHICAPHAEPRHEVGEEAHVLLQAAVEVPEDDLINVIIVIIITQYLLLIL